MARFLSGFSMMGKILSVKTDAGQTSKQKVFTPLVDKTVGRDDFDGRMGSITFRGTKEACPCDWFGCSWCCRYFSWWSATIDNVLSGKIGL